MLPRVLGPGIHFLHSRSPGFLYHWSSRLFHGHYFGTGTAIVTRKELEDGTIVRVKRPLIGLKSHEIEVDVTGGYEVRSDGYRYEEALLRI
jgi:hypothetical protein